MRTDWKAAAVPMIAVMAVIAIVAGIAIALASDGGDGTRYEVTVRFNKFATQDDLFEAGALLGTYDDDLEFVIMEIFPPIGRAVLATDAPDFCPIVEAELEAEGYIDGVTCQPWAGNDGGDPGGVISTDNDIESPQAR